MVIIPFLQSWKYKECTATNYVTFFLNNLLFYKFKQTMGSEIRDKPILNAKELNLELQKLIQNYFHKLKSQMIMTEHKFSQLILKD